MSIVGLRWECADTQLQRLHNRVHNYCVYTAAAAAAAVYPGIRYGAVRYVKVLYHSSTMLTQSTVHLRPAEFCLPSRTKSNRCLIFIWDKLKIVFATTISKCYYSACNQLICKSTVSILRGTGCCAHMGPMI